MRIGGTLTGYGDVEKFPYRDFPYSRLVLLDGDDYWLRPAATVDALPEIKEEWIGKPMRVIIRSGYIAAIHPTGERNSNGQHRRSA